jgi:hypothetical protein
MRLLSANDRNPPIYPRRPGWATPGSLPGPAVYRQPQDRLSSRTIDPGPTERLRYARLIRQIAGLALRNPRLLPSLVAAAWRFRARGWYRRPPFLPLPPRDYIAWRLYTAYGSEDAVPPARDLARYLGWSSRLMKGARRN